jgi:hypothetical protein
MNSKCNLCNGKRREKNKSDSIRCEYRKTNKDVCSSIYLSMEFCSKKQNNVKRFNKNYCCDEKKSAKPKPKKKPNWHYSNKSCSSNKSKRLEFRSRAGKA